MRRLMCMLCLCLTASTVWANCLDLNIASFTQAQREHIISGALTLEPTIDLVQRLVPGEIHLCSSTANISALTAGALQTASQAAYDASVATTAAKSVEQSEITTELDTNLLCRGATLADIISRLNAERDAITVTINASTTLPLARDALTNMNTRYSAAFKQIARCMVGFMRLQR